MRTKRQIINNGDGTASVPLTQGRFAIIDIEDAHEISRHNWFLWTAKKTRSVYAATKIHGRRVRMHRLLVATGEQIDHINGDGLNNRRSNLRSATHAQNVKNARTRSDNTSGYRGVTYKPRNRKWVAQIATGNGKSVYLGIFDTPELAAFAYNLAAYQYHGEFAKINESVM